MWIEFVGGAISSLGISYIEKYPNTSYLKAFLVAFCCGATPIALLVFVLSKNSLEDLLIGVAASSGMGLLLGGLTVIILFFINRPKAKKDKASSQESPL